MPRGGQYPIATITLALQLVFNAGSSLRGSSAAMNTFVDGGFADFAVPAASTIRSWILRLGLFALNRPLDKTQPWFWLIDHTVQIGSKKLLVILGGSLNQVRFGQRALASSELQLVALVPMEASNGRLVEGELERAALRTGVPQLIVSDRGGDLVKGIDNYSELRPAVKHVLDAAHLGANLLERSWESQPLWSEFIEKTQQTSSKLRQSKVAELTAPQLRPKGRFLNLGVLLRFVSLLLLRLDAAKPDAKVQEHYGWLREYREPLATWLAEHRLVRATIRHLRVHGLHARTRMELHRLWRELGLRERPHLRALAKQWCDYVRQHQPTEGSVRYVASTEVLESSFGKLKRVSGQQSRSGLTGLVLAMGTVVGNLSDEQVRLGLESTPQKKVDSWVGRCIGRTVQWLRRRFLRNSSD